jgi:DNA-binding NarL/FixJ family response regulator
VANPPWFDKEVPMPVRVLVVDDQEPFRSAAAAVVAATDGFLVVGSAASGEASLLAVEQLRPDLVLMDIHLPGMDGLESTRQIHKRQPGVRVLLLSSHDTYDDAGKCGALGYLPKRTLSPSRLQGVWAGQRLPERSERHDSSE